MLLVFLWTQLPSLDKAWERNMHPSHKRNRGKKREIKGTNKIFSVKRCQLQVNKLWSWLQLARKRRKNIYCRLFIYISQHTYHALWDVFVLLYRVSFNLTYHWSIWCAFGMYRPQMIYRKFLKYQTANHRNHSSMNKYFGNSGNCFPSCLTPNYWPGNCINVFLQQIQLEVPKKKTL